MDVNAKDLWNFFQKKVFGRKKLNFLCRSSSKMSIFATKFIYLYTNLNNYV